MNMKNEPVRPEARLPKGLFDTSAAEIRAREMMLASIRKVFESYGFEPLDTPAIEYTDVLGKFLPDQDRPNEGVFSFKDDDGEWLSLRYDLTAPFARYVAENYEDLPKPFRRYQTGFVWRNEKPGPGRFRQFMQFDADTVGAGSIAADAELCMLAADTLEALGVPDGQYVVKLGNRKVLDGVLESIGLKAGETGKHLTVLRAVDKLDRLGIDGVRALLGKGRKDESGDFTPGAELNPKQIDTVVAFVESGNKDHRQTLSAMTALVSGSAPGGEGIDELAQMDGLLSAAGFGSDRVRIDPSVVRGLEYYTGPVFEAEFTAPITDERGQPIRLGSLVSGGRYDGLVERFTGEKMPATGVSIGVSRLLYGLQLLGQYKASAMPGPVVVLVLDRDRIADYQRMAAALRNAGIRAEIYLGASGMKAQMKYADKRGSSCVVIQGGDERAKGEVTIKDLIEGAEKSKIIADNVAWREERPGQFTVPEKDLVEAVRGVLARQQG
jgi:histidyl-tRNA synthetase